MPFDGLLFGSWMMIAKEARTAPAVKDLIVATPGVTDQNQWEQSYSGNAGGVTTVLSELGEPIHKIFTKAVEVWKEFDEKLFSKPRGVTVAIDVHV